MTPARIVAIDTAPERLDFATRLGADHAVLGGDDSAAAEIRRLTGGRGADVVLDFVAEGETPDHAMKMLRRGGAYSIVGYGGTLSTPTVNLIVQELSIIGNFVGTYRDLVELMELNAQGKVRITSQRYRLADATRALDDLKHGRIIGRGDLIP